MQALDDEGRPLDAEYSVEADEGRLALVLDSAGGADKLRPARNPQYLQALAILLSRLRDLDGVITDALVDSQYTQDRGLAAAERTLISAPVRLAHEQDIEALRRRLTSGQARIGQKPGTTGRGSTTKRIRLELEVPGYAVTDPARLADRLRAPLPRSVIQRRARPCRSQH